jgi:hypothetical protein
MVSTTVSAETAFAAAAEAAGAGAAVAAAGLGAGVIAGGLTGVAAGAAGGVADLVCPQANVARRRPVKRKEILITYRIAGATMASDGPPFI